MEIDRIRNGAERLRTDSREHRQGLSGANEGDARDWRQGGMRSTAIASPARMQDARVARVIIDRRRQLEAGKAGNPSPDRIFLGRADFDDEMASRIEQVPRRRNNSVQYLVAAGPAVECQMRLIVADAHR